MMDFDRESFYELLSEEMANVNILFIENNLPSIETYDEEENFMMKEDDQSRLVELFREVQDIIKRNQ
jgi:hypothetical protein